MPSTTPFPDADPDDDVPDLSPGEVTQLLHAITGGDQRAMDRLLPLIYDELRKHAHYQLRRYRPGDTLNTTALVHEAYLKLSDQDGLDWNNRAHFMAIAAQAMRYIIIDYARKQSAQKRGGDEKPLPLEDHQIAVQERAGDLIDLDAALTWLAEREARMAKVVEYRFFGGLTVKETAAVLDVSDRTVKRDWRMARALLAKHLKGGRDEA
jgi:RNA polymerase sigma factor (TIGR02999 family)